MGVDVGGTHTDVQLVVGDELARGKALTTYDDFSRGVLEAIEVAAAELNLTRADVLERGRLAVNATTVVTNAITQLRGGRPGVLVTAGFRDEFRFAGCSRISEFDDQLQVNVPDIVERRNIAEIQERIDYAGEVIIAVDPDEVAEAAQRLVEEGGVDSIAICFLSSFTNPDNEKAAAEAVRRRYPDLFVTASHEVTALLGETRRWTTALLNCFVHKQAHEFLSSLDGKLRSEGLGGGLAFFQGLGGGISKERAEQFPLALLGAGPAGGVVGANQLAAAMGEKNVLIGDMGGTSFDTGIIVDNEVSVAREIDLGLFRTALSLVDVVSVGAGGGSIAWISERGVPQVGPRSAGSIPGPAAYGQGGDQPTLTDAMVVMGIIDPANYLGGRVALHQDRAEAALLEKFAEPMGWSLDEAAAAVHDLAVTTMAHAVREVSVNKGHDPRDFLFLAYGGTLPMFAVQIGRALGIKRVVVPRDSPVFCAWGLLMSDYLLRYDQTVNWNLTRLDEIKRVNDVGRSLEETARRAITAEGFTDEDVVIERSGDLQFAGQVHALSLPLPDQDLDASEIGELKERFLKLYESTYGVGTAWTDMPEQLVNYTVTARGSLPRPPLDPVPAQPTDEAAMRKGEREVFQPDAGERRRTPIYDERLFTVGSSVSGPAVMEATDTTIYVPAGVVATRDPFTNIVLTETTEDVR
ncbi:hydantoinase/oxoprolinase family protein [Mycolicibacterium thermoresistibile]